MTYCHTLSEKRPPVILVKLSVTIGSPVECLFRNIPIPIFNFQQPEYKYLIFGSNTNLLNDKKEYTTRSRPLNRRNRSRSLISPGFKQRKRLVVVISEPNPQNHFSLSERCCHAY